MNNFIEEVLNVCKLPLNEISKDFKSIQLGNRAIYISNYLRIIDYSDMRLLLKVKNDYYEVYGNRLQIKQLNKGEIIVTGVICGTKLGEKYEK